MTRIEFEIDDETESLVAAMAKEEGIDIEQLSKAALMEYLKFFDCRCITTSASGDKRR